MKRFALLLLVALVSVPAFAGDPPRHVIAGSVQWVASEFCSASSAAAYFVSVTEQGVNGAPVIAGTRDYNPRWIVWKRMFADATATPDGLSFKVFTDPNQALYAYNNTLVYNKGYVTASNGEIIVWEQNGAYPCQ